MPRLLPRLPAPLIVVAAIALAATAGEASAATPRLTGPAGVSDDKVLVIGIDGLRWDVLQRLAAEGRARHLARLGRKGIAAPTLLPYAPPQAATLSEVGWCTVATGAGPGKHGVNGIFLNNDPRQSSKNGYLDFLGRAESLRPRLSTFLASVWANIGRRQNGGPIFSGPIDSQHALALGGTDPVEWDAGDREVTHVTARYLRRGEPDAGFVYLGLPDAVAHSLGSATPRYRDAIATTDARVGRLLEAIRRRSTVRRERWTVIVTTDHGQQHLTYGSLAAHGFGSNLERTSFVIADGPGIPRRVSDPTPGVVDIAPTVLRQLGLRADPGWRLDGHPFVRRGSRR